MTVSTEQFADTVRDRSGLGDRLGDTETVIRAAGGVLTVLGERLTAGAAQPLAERLPDAFARPLTQASPVSEGGTMDDFYASVARSTGFAEADVPALVAGVTRALVETGDPEAIAAAREQLTTELQVLLQADTSEGDTGFRAAAGPQDPTAPNIAGPEADV